MEQHLHKYKLQPWKETSKTKILQKTKEIIDFAGLERNIEITGPLSAFYKKRKTKASMDE